jgi:molybdenum cofactor cytidylyltransferase
LKKVRANRCGIVVLAAGMSSRLGTPKQLLVYEGKTVMVHAVETALGTGMQPLVVVLGAHAELLEKELEATKGVKIVINQGWQEGMASSIRIGVQAAMDSEPGMDALIVMVCDQPFVTGSVLKELFNTQQTSGMPMVASVYEGVSGVPALFHRNFFQSLLKLTGDRGAKKLLKDHSDLVALVNFPEGQTDIDTVQDFLKLNEKERKKRND